MKNPNQQKKMKKLRVTNYSNKITSENKSKKKKKDYNLQEQAVKILRNKGFTFTINELYQNGYDIVTFDIHVTEPLDFVVQLNFGTVVRTLGVISYYKMISKSKIYLGMDYDEFPEYPNPENTIFKLLNLYNIDVALFDKNDMITLRPRELFI